MCPALTNLVTKLFQINDSISCCDDEMDRILYFASKDNTWHCLVQSKALLELLVLEMFIIRHMATSCVVCSGANTIFLHPCNW